MTISTPRYRTSLRLAALTGALFASTSGLTAQEFDFTLDPSASSVDLDSDYEVDLTTTLIGDHDATTNPGGTRTLPGLFGGSGNQTVPVDIDIGGTLDHLGVPSGTLSMDVNTVTMGFELSDLDLDLLGGGAATSDLALDLLFQTFRTFTPNSLFLGGLPINVPLAGQTITDVLVQQSIPTTPGVLSPGTGAGHFGFTTAVPVTLSMVVDFQGTPTAVGPWDVILPLNGELIITGQSASLTILVNQSFQQTTVDPLSGQGLTDVPFDVPTILPPGSTAHLLLSGSVDQVDLDMDLVANFVANGVPSCGVSHYCVAHPNSTGMVGQITASGSMDVADEDLTLSVSSLPTNVFGFFLMSPDQDQYDLPAPGQGVLCMGSPFYRLNAYILNSAGTGSMSLDLDFGSLPQGQVFQAGSTWNFQLWHRDNNPGSTSNTTNAVSVRFCQ